MSNDNGVLNLRVVYTFVIDLGHDLNGGWKFSFIFFGGLDTTHKICSKLINIHTKTSCFCKTNVTIKEQTMLHPTAAVSLTPDDDTNPFPIIIAFFGIIVICQTLYIVYIKRQKLVGRYRDISTRPPQPLPLDIYDQVEDQHEQGFTNKAFNIANQRTTPKVARKAPQALSMMPLGQAHNVAGKRTAPNVAKTQSQVLLALSSPKDKRLRCLKSTHMNQGSCPRSRPRPRPRPQRRSKTGAPTNMQELITINNRVTWEEDWQYERLAPMQKYL
ncbi:uncharacterized protein LOC111354804 [Spodoptera litura]|uniref:Uncharacterized protein LOC111354804 n=1 Tax=Spodoptera litura TaxID=69820 RepID=A0A9J7E8G1_SPOLT|nr:uncharacterized protein LOC111354804 [Spodoptera litura]